MPISVNVDQMLALLLASGSPSVAVDQTLALLVEQRLQPQTIYNRVDQMLAMIVERRGISGVLTVNSSLVPGNGSAQATITATISNPNGTPVVGVLVSVAQNGSSTISVPSGATDSNGHVFWTVTDTIAELVTYTISLPSNSVSVQFTANRVGGTVFSQRGPAIAGAQIYAVNQPANTASLPPTPLLSIFSDVNGSIPIAQPIITDGSGSYRFYASTGLFTLVVANNGSTTQTYADMEIGKPTAAYHSVNAWIKSTLGPAVPGSQLFLLSNDFPNIPTTLYKGAPNPQQQTYSDSAGLFPLPQPNISSGFGFDTCYAPAGVYTMALYLGGTLQAVYQDVSVGGVLSGPLARYRGWVKNALGQAQPNSRVIVSLQPCSIPGALVPLFPTNLASLCSDVNGLAYVQQSLTFDANGKAIIQSLVTDGNGFFTFTYPPNIPLTISIYNQSNRLVQTFVDQVL
jgi:hypothetical protein